MCVRVCARARACLLFLGGCVRVRDVCVFLWGEGLDPLVCPVLKHPTLLGACTGCTAEHAGPAQCAVCASAAASTASWHPQGSPLPARAAPSAELKELLTRWTSKS